METNAHFLNFSHLKKQGLDEKVISGLIEEADKYLSCMGFALDQVEISI